MSYTTTSTPGASVRILIQFSEALPNNVQLCKVDEAGGFTLLPARLWERLDDWILALTLTDGDPLTDEPVGWADAGSPTIHRNGSETVE